MLGRTRPLISVRAITLNKLFGVREFSATTQLTIAGDHLIMAGNTLYNPFTDL